MTYGSVLSILRCVAAVSSEYITSVGILYLPYAVWNYRVESHSAEEVEHRPEFFSSRQDRQSESIRFNFCPDSRDLSCEFTVFDLVCLMLKQATYAASLASNYKISVPRGGDLEGEIGEYGIGETECQADAEVVRMSGRYATNCSNAPTLLEGERERAIEGIGDEA